MKSFPATMKLFLLISHQKCIFTSTKIMQQMFLCRIGTFLVHLKENQHLYSLTQSKNATFLNNATAEVKVSQDNYRLYLLIQPPPPKKKNYPSFINNAMKGKSFHRKIHWRGKLINARFRQRVVTNFWRTQAKLFVMRHSRQSHFTRYLAASVLSPACCLVFVMRILLMEMW